MTSSIQPVSPGREPVEKVSNEALHKRKSMDRGTQTIPETQNSKVCSAQNQQEKTSFVSPEKPLQGSDSGIRISQLDKEGSISSLTPSKLPETPTRGSNGLPSLPEGRSPIIREKVSEDGFHWRKYGQKFVRGNEFVRSYYRCTHPSCPVKKQLECSLDGQIADIVYFGQHDHPKPEVNVPVPVGFLLSDVEEKRENTVSKATEIKVKLAPPPLPVLSANNSQISTVTSSEDVTGVLSESRKKKDEVCNHDPISKRQKIAAHNMDLNHEDNPTGETRVVVQTVSEVDIVSDGYRWRKYGQKMVKGNPNPRSYYRCSYPGCPVKKHVERASHDPKVVLTSYEGQHEHNVPQSRTVTHNAGGHGATVQHGDRGSVVSLEVAVISGSEPERKLKEKPDGKLETKVKAEDNVSSDVVVPAYKPNAKQNGKSDVKEEIQAAEVVGTSSVSVYASASELNEQDNGRPKAESNENGSSCSPDVVTGNKQHVPITGPVQS